MENDVFIEIYQQYLRYVYRYLYGLMWDHQKAEDLTQEVFIKAFCVLDFPEAGIKSWLLTVAHNLYVDSIKKNQRLAFHSDEVLFQYAAQDMHAVVADREALAGVFAQLKALPEAQRQAVMLCLVNELPYTEAAKIMGVSVSSVTNLIYRARQRLRSLRRKEE